MKKIARILALFSLIATLLAHQCLFAELSLDQVNQINKIFAAATALYADMGGSGVVTAENGTIALTDGENTTPFGKLPLTDKVCLFIAVKLCLQKAAFPELETVLLHGEITLDKVETAARLGGLKDKNFIVEAMSASV